MVRVLDCIECSGPRTFLRAGFPCVRYTNHYFLTGATDSFPRSLSMLHAALMMPLGEIAILSFFSFSGSKHQQVFNPSLWAALLYSILLGFLGLDRFCLGQVWMCCFKFNQLLSQTGTAVGKLLTLGGLGIWWIVDIFLLVTGHLSPDDNSNWIPLMWFVSSLKGHFLSMIVSSVL